MTSIYNFNFRNIIYTLVIIVISCIGSYISYSCNNNCAVSETVHKEPVIVQEKKDTYSYHHIFYRKVSDWSYGKLDVGRYDFDNISVGDTLYLTFK